MTTVDGLFNAFLLMIGGELSIPIWALLYMKLAGKTDFSEGSLIPNESE